jgi:hypothetical protein
LSLQVVHHTSAQLEALIAEVAQKYVHTRRIELDGMLALLTTLNAKGALPSGMSIASGGFLLLYNMLQGATQCRLHSSNCSQVHHHTDGHRVAPIDLLIVLHAKPSTTNCTC